MKFINSQFLLVVISIVSLGVFIQSSQIPSQDNWEYLLDEDLSRWDKFIGVPHYTVKLDGYEKGDGRNGTPIGLNKDPLNVFYVIMVDKNPVLSITGEIYQFNYKFSPIYM